RSIRHRRRIPRSRHSWTGMVVTSGACSDELRAAGREFVLTGGVDVPVGDDSCDLIKATDTERCPLDELAGICEGVYPLAVGDHDLLDRRLLELEVGDPDNGVDRSGADKGDVRVDLAQELLGRLPVGRGVTGADF